MDVICETSSSENELIRLCKLKCWTLVEERSIVKPQEAVPSHLAVNGETPTALALAIRKGAPMTVIQSLVKAEPYQLCVKHKVNGTVLHEAIEQYVSLKVVKYLLDASKSNKSCQVLEEENYLGRTVLHCMILRSMSARDCPGMMWNILKELALSSPSSARSFDHDGNTPLHLLLSYHSTNPDQQLSVTRDFIYRTVKLLVATCPEVATLRQPTPCCNQGTSGYAAESPLTYAFLYNHSEDVVEILLNTGDRCGINPCSSYLSRYRELPLHMALTLRSSVSLLQKILDIDTNAIFRPDTQNLFPLDWLWIRYTLDWCSDSFPSTVSPSTRRYLCNNFYSLHQHVSNEVGTHSSISTLDKHLWERIKLLVPLMAAVKYNKNKYLGGERWSILHSICMVNCPLAMVRLCLRRLGKEELMFRDQRMSRMALHYGATRHGYRAKLFLGPTSRNVQIIAEPSPVFELLKDCPRAAYAADGKHQLPLHILIDTLASSSECDIEAVSFLLDHYPGSIERRDGKSKLYPFLQAATGKSDCVALSFFLLQKNPTLISRCLIHQE